MFSIASQWLSGVRETATVVAEAPGIVHAALCLPPEGDKPSALLYSFLEDALKKIKNLQEDHDIDYLRLCQV